ncbi:MAG: alpha/beta fold hydrolase [Patescibacteria group bacterium]
MKRVILIHGWQGHPGNHWKKWFKGTLIGKGIRVIEPEMPNHSNKPVDWINKLAEVVGIPDMDTVLVGHSLGCPTIIGYLMSLQGDQKVRGAVLVAGFSSRLAPHPDLNDFNFDNALVAETKKHCEKFVSIVSDNDSDVPNEKSIELNTLVDGELIMEHNKGHFCESDGVTKLQSALDSVLQILE